MRRVLRITLNFQYLFEFIPNFSILDHLLGVAYIEAEESNQLEKGGLLQPHLALKTPHFCLEVALYLRERIQRIIAGNIAHNATITIYYHDQRLNQPTDNQYP